VNTPINEILKPFPYVTLKGLSLLIPAYFPVRSKTLSFVSPDRSRFAIFVMLYYVFYKVID